MNTLILPPGKYYIGDPCYVFDDDLNDWNGTIETPGMCDVICGGGNTYKGMKFFCDNTAYGDGGYLGSNDFEYGVDAGIIGAIPFEIVSKPDGLECGTVIETTSPLHCSCENGLFSFTFGDSHIIIDTDPSEEDDDEGGYGDDYTFDDDEDKDEFDK